MCGVPHHSAANYIARLVRKGYRVAICEQTEEAGKTKKLVRREVVRIVTPGTPIDPQLLEAREPVFLAAVCTAGEQLARRFSTFPPASFASHRKAGATHGPASAPRSNLTTARIAVSRIAGSADQEQSFRQASNCSVALQQDENESARYLRNPNTASRQH